MAKLQLNFDSDKILLHAILRQGNKMQMSQRMAAHFVGGKARLERLIMSGKIQHFEKPSKAQNGKVYFNGGEVLRNALIRL